MNTSGASHLPAQLEDFRRRLTGGVLPAARGTRPEDWAERDAEAIGTEDIASLLDPLLHLVPITGTTWQDVETVLRAVPLRHDQIRTLLFSPDHVLTTIPAAQRTVDDTPTPALVWAWMCWLTEAAERPLSDGTVHDAPLLLPLLHRLRFLVLSEPLRHREDSDWGPPIPGIPGPCDYVFGHRSWPLLVQRAQQARHDWLATLHSYQSHPLLAGVRTDALDAELVLTVADSWSYRTRFSTTHQPLCRPSAPTVRDDAALGEVVRRHLLPRFRLLHTARLVPVTGRLPWRSTVLALGGAAVGTAVVGGFTDGPWFHAAAALAALAYALLIAGIIHQGPLWGVPWLLRFPAAAAFGLFALLALPMNWWSDPHPRWGVAAAVLVCAAYGYLAVEVRNHGVAGRQTLGRALAVLLAGAAHAFLLSLVMLVGVAATYGESDPESPGRISLAELWHTTGLAWQTLALATVWSLTVGVFSQILWDDRPITAPLAHLTWNDS